MRSQTKLRYPTQIRIPLVQGPEQCSMKCVMWRLHTQWAKQKHRKPFVKDHDGWLTWWERPERLYAIDHKPWGKPFATWRCCPGQRPYDSEEIDIEQSQSSFQNQVPGKIYA
ncbi:hypothetical protein AWENTII_008168 [Aspergillus wentii]|nr:hypothetical protein MW887_002480 [Aspergillus wentii]